MLNTILAISITLAIGTVTRAQTGPDPDWPCIQVLVPTISAASIWDGPVIEDIQYSEDLEQRTRPIVADVVIREQELTEAGLGEYLSKTQNHERNNALSYLFKALLDSLNTRRHQQIETIRQYTRVQRQTAQNIQTLLDEMSTLKEPGNDNLRLQDIESELYWQNRMFTQRERSFRYLCELPQGITRKAGNIARMISAQLEY